MTGGSESDGAESADVVDVDGKGRVPSGNKNAESALKGSWEARTGFADIRDFRKQVAAFEYVPPYAKVTPTQGALPM